MRRGRNPVQDVVDGLFRVVARHRALWRLVVGWLVGWLSA
jgi:hypothetical protein